MRAAVWAACGDSARVPCPPALAGRAESLVESWTLLCFKGIWLGLVVAAPLGPVNLAMIDRGLRQGFRAAFLLGLGSTVADLVYILAAYAGAEPLARTEGASLLLFGAGAIVLTWLGAGAVRDAVAPVLSPMERGDAALFRRGPFAAGALLALVNPMSIASWLGILGAELAGRERAETPREHLFVAAIVLGLLIWVIGLSTALHYGRRVVRGRALRFVSLAAGVSLIGYGAHFALKALTAL